MTPNQMPRKGTRVIKVNRLDYDWKPMKQMKLQPLSKPNYSIAAAWPAGKRVV